LGTAVYRTVRTVVWEDGTPVNDVPPTRLYEELGDENAQAICLRDLVSLSRENAVGEYYLKLKDLVGPAQWQKEREAVLKSTRSDLCRRTCLAAEGAAAELWREVKDAGFYELTRFEDALAESYAEQIAALYREQLLDDLARASTRKGYQRALITLKRIKRLPGGDSRAAEVARKVESLYPKRTALLDELSKALV